jgi:hypothetical protein
VVVVWLAMQMEVIPSPQTSMPVKLHAVTSQTWDLNILGQQESCVEYIPVYRIVMLCCWAKVVLSISKEYSVFVFRIRQAKTIDAPCYYNILAGQGDQILNPHMDISHSCAHCITLMLQMKHNFLRVNMWKLLLFVFYTPNWSDTKYILSCGTM